MTNVNIDLGRLTALLRSKGMTEAALTIEQSVEVAGDACRILGFQDPASGPAAGAGGELVKKDCGCGGGGGGGAAAPTAMRGALLPTMLGGYPVWAAARGLLGGCYIGCRALDPCLTPYMEDAFLRFDSWAWRSMSTTDPIVVHLNKSVGVAPYNTALPLNPSDTILFAQEDAQMLPYNPGGIKVDPKWSAAAAPAEVTVQLFTGKNGLTGFTDTTGLVPIGGPLTLADFECKDDCYILAFPLLDNCIAGPIPDLRSLYVQISASATMGATTLTSLNFTILKKGTQRYVASCQRWGWDPASGCAPM